MTQVVLLIALNNTLEYMVTLGYVMVIGIYRVVMSSAIGLVRDCKQHLRVVMDYQNMHARDTIFIVTLLEIIIASGMEHRVLKEKNVLKFVMASWLYLLVVFFPVFTVDNIIKKLEL